MVLSLFKYAHICIQVNIFYNKNQVFFHLKREIRHFFLKTFVEIAFWGLFSSLIADENIICRSSLALLFLKFCGKTEKEN